MKTTNKLSCRTIINVLVGHGVRDVVLSPGSRNAPLIIAANRSEMLRKHIVIDERSAAFFGLGIALQTNRPVALICTSGSAVLNYGPALAEAYYRHVPLIAISADRPPEWIDQDDSQTIRQAGVLDNIVKGSFDIGVESGAKAYSDFINRTVNDALMLSLQAPQGPVHINVRLDEPLGSIVDIDENLPRIISRVECRRRELAESEASALADKVSGMRTLVIVGFHAPDKALNEALESFSEATGAVVMYEAQSNIRLAKAIGHIDATLTAISSDKSDILRPQIVITLGGSLVSRMIKRYLREIRAEHWHIGDQPYSTDCFMSLARRVDMPPVAFFEALIRNAGHPSVDCIQFRNSWMEAVARARRHVSEFYADCPWSDFYVMGRILERVPSNWNLHLSNGTAVRYAQLFDYSVFNRIDCNRGVSGIDGSTSTAVGSHIYYEGTTLLVSGDMSAQYDIGALALTGLSPRFKIAVLNNDGGGIFRFIASTSDLEECEKCFAADVRLPLEMLSKAYGFAYYEADGKENFDEAFDRFIEEDDRPAIIDIKTPSRLNAQILRQFFNQKKI